MKRTLSHKSTNKADDQNYNDNTSHVDLSDLELAKREELKKPIFIQFKSQYEKTDKNSSPLSNDKPIIRMSQLNFQNMFYDDSLVKRALRIKINNPSYYGGWSILQNDNDELSSINKNGRTEAGIESICNRNATEHRLIITLTDEYDDLSINIIAYILKHGNDKGIHKNLTPEAKFDAIRLGNYLGLVVKEPKKAHH